MEHIMGNYETTESITRNEIGFFIQCGEELIATKFFSKLATEKEIKDWTNEVFNAHQENCPILNEGDDNG